MNNKIKTRIDDQPFQISHINYNKDLYNDELTIKVDSLKNLFKNFHFLDQSVNLDIVQSPQSHYRNKCRFGISRNPQDRSKLVYSMWEDGIPSIEVKSFPLAVSAIFVLMNPMLRIIELNAELSSQLKSMTFLSTQNGHIIVSMCYQRPLENSWKECAMIMKKSLLDMHLIHVEEINIIGRSKGIKIVIGSEQIIEMILLADGRQLRYCLIEDGFCNPNMAVNSKVLDWVCESVSFCNRVFLGAGKNKVNILEMFCGNGNHTIAMSGNKYFYTIFIYFNKSKRNQQDLPVM
jgi:tRNA (uracil-5-)-methyltransferase